MQVHACYVLTPDCMMYKILLFTVAGIPGCVLRLLLLLAHVFLHAGFGQCFAVAVRV